MQATMHRQMATGGEVAPGVWRLGSDFINWYVVEESGRLTAIDAGVPKFGETLDEDLAAAGFSVTDVEAVVLTHSDSDHTGVVPSLQEAGARVLIHSGDQETLRRPRPKKGDARPSRLVREMWRPGLYRMMGTMARLGAGHPPKIEGAETFSDGDVLDVPGRPRVVHTPGHTPGNSAIWLEQRGVLFAGDTICTLNPLTRSRGPQLMPSSFNVSNADAAESLARLERLEAGVVLMGHGEPWLEGPRAAVAAARKRLLG
jgi:glyoxylase-like metal-dependent hydrolase (beta-lactamase superfamily II)